MKKIFNWFKNLWQKEVDKIDDVLDSRPAKNSGMTDGDVIIKIKNIVVDDLSLIHI